MINLLTPELINRAIENSKIMGLQAKFVEGDAEFLPYQENKFDIILSQYGHMFAPRPSIVVKELARVLKPGGILAFSTWPKELFMGKFFKVIEDFSPPLPSEVESPVLWGDMAIIEKRLGDHFEKIEFVLMLLFSYVSMHVFRYVSRHVYRYVSSHVYRNVYRQVYRKVARNF